jgi:acyl dehydratase
MSQIHPPGHVPRNARIGETFERSVTIGAEEIRAFAASVADFNPLHHDEAAAARSRFGALIASGTHSASLLMALTATHFSQRAQPLGLDFSLKFRKAVKAGDTLQLRWTVTRIEFKPSLNGELVSLDGEAVNQHGEVALSSTALLLVMDKI